MNECRKYAERIGRELEKYYEGSIYRCPECGQEVEVDSERGHCICGESFLIEEAEQLSLYDYFDDVLDLEYVVDSRKDYLSVRVFVTLGGPTAWIDTDTKSVECRWGSETGAFRLLSDVVNDIDDIFEEQYNC